MNGVKYIAGILCLWLTVSVLAGCQRGSADEQKEVEWLTHKAFDMRYTNPDSVVYYSQQALDRSAHYATGKAEAYNNLALASLMRQDFRQAQHYLDLSEKSSNNQLEHLFSDVARMRICQRTAQNKRFYDYYNRAARSIHHLQEEIDVLSEHDRARLALAVSDFHLVASTYYYYMQQENRAVEELSQLDLADIAQHDSIQWTYAMYVIVASGVRVADTPQLTALSDFDGLLQALFVSRQEGTIYLEANILQTYAEKLEDADWSRTIRTHRRGELAFLNPQEVPDSLLPTRLSRESLHLFEQFGDLYQLACAHRSLADMLFNRGQYDEAQEQLELSLKDINNYLKKQLPKQYASYVLKSVDESDSISTDRRLLDEQPMALVPQWLANIRESFSMVYSAQGKKWASDYNRNAYLDILERTRQDKELENRYEELQSEAESRGWLLLLVAGIMVFGLLGLYFLNKRWRRRNDESIHRLQRVAQYCRDIVGNCQSEEENSALQQERADLLAKDASLERVIRPYEDWAKLYVQALEELEDEHEQLEKERYVHEQHVSDYKRQNLEKRTCMSIVYGITPFLDRMLNEVQRLGSDEDEAVSKQRYEYICELVDRINEYNDILALWIKMKQGTLSLHIENFCLQDLLETIAKGHRAFEQKQLTLTVNPSDSWVKADKALTLFIINTLAENARKYTPAGGSVTIGAKETDQYVEISVTDTGNGLSEADVHRILEEKVYDSSQIGMQEGDEQAQQELKRNKGFGFGLMNCKGIIDKYRKTNALFSVCLFSIESTLGKGSRFFFRLPKGVARMCIALLLLLGGGTLQAAETADSLLLKEASRFADSTYYANVDGYYEDALMFADSACSYLNKYYKLLQPQGTQLIGIHPDGGLAELDWWNEGLMTDYHIILDIRNEVAVASLALCQWSQYRLNNQGYTLLYKLLGEDNNLEAYCRDMQHAATNRTLAMWLIVVLMLLFLVAYYVLYFRHALLYRMGMEQALQANRKILQLKGLDGVEQMLQSVYPDMNDIHPIRGLALLIDDGGRNVYPPVATRKELLTPLLESLLQRVAERGEQQTEGESGTLVLPLTVNLGDSVSTVGALALIQPVGGYGVQDELLNNLVVSYLAIMVYQMLIHLTHKQSDVELAEDETRRAIHEENQLHVQNMMLDNTLSALKHETMYYPNRIRQMVEHLQLATDAAAVKSQVRDMRELMDYYKEVFTLLSSCAQRNVVNVKLNRQAVPVRDLLEYAQRYLNKRLRKLNYDWTLTTDSVDVAVTGDSHLLEFLMECLVDAALKKAPFNTTVELQLQTAVEGDFVRFDFTDPRGSYSQEELNGLFYPHLDNTAGTPTLSGTSYLTIRQIIRDHEELSNHRGCRVNAEPVQSGYRLWFTLPIKKERYGEI